MEVKINGIYRHYKGDYYLVEDIAINSDTEEKMVIYRALYGENTLYVKSYENFIMKLEDKGVYRFTLQEIKSVKDEENEKY